ncbi:MAG: hypothetical protein ABI318_15600 [Chthoniobacteraceae bacterium]
MDFDMRADSDSASSRHTATGAELESVKSLRASVAGTGDVKAVRSLTHGPLTITV